MRLGDAGVSGFQLLPIASLNHTIPRPNRGPNGPEREMIDDAALHYYQSINL
jgi:hypothetical protein